MIWSVSTSARARGSAPPAQRRTEPLSGRAAARTLPALEVAVRGGRAALARSQDVRIHPEAHRTARVAPFEPRVDEDAIETFSLGIGLHAHRSGHDEPANARSHVPSTNDLRGRAEILQTRV